MFGLRELKQKVLQTVSAEGLYKRYYPSQLGDTTFNHNILCPFHEDHNPSLRLYEDGGFKCYGCNKSGTTFIPFIEYLFDISYKDALLKIYSECIEQVYDSDIILNYHQALLKDSETIEFLKKKRLWSDEVIRQLLIGWDGDRIVIPVANEFGLVTSILKYNVYHKSEYPKFEPLSKGMKVQSLFPIQHLGDMNSIFLVEGYPDAIAGLSQGLATFTTGSAGAWRDIYAGILTGKTIVIIQDNDGPGRDGAERIAARLVGHASSIRILELPFNDPTGKDLTDWLLEGHKKEELFGLIEQTQYFSLPDPIKVLSGDISLEADKNKIKTVKFDDLYDPKNFMKPFKVVADVVGKGDVTYLAPTTVRVSCTKRGTDKKCKSCPCRSQPAFDYTIDYTNKNYLRLTNCTTEQQQKILKEVTGVGKSCDVDFTILTTERIEVLLLNKPIQGFSEGENTYINAVAFHIGPTTNINQRYLFYGYTTTHPKDSSLLALFYDCAPVSNPISTFKVDDVILPVLRKFEVQKGKELWPHFEEIYKLYEEHITQIKGRMVTHMAMDLVFYSPNDFIFNGEYIPSGPLDVLILGDTRCGKGNIGKRISKFYGTGEFISGENVTFMNLVAGVNMISRFRGIQFGRFAINNGGTVLIDELSGMDADLISKLSRVRSEAIAEIDKGGMHMKAPAHVGKIFISNPRGNRKMSQFSYGIEAIKSLIGAPEDIARFDYVVGLSNEESSAEEINRLYETNGTVLPFSGNECNHLITWVKSRKPDQILFTKDATMRILEYAKTFPNLFSSDIPLVQVENFRIKLAKVSIAIAGRTFSNKKAGEFLIVDINHVECAIQFFRTIYDSECLNFKFYSHLKQRSQDLDEEGIVEELTRVNSNVSMKDFVDGLMLNDYLTIHEFSAFGNVDSFIAKRLINVLISKGCLVRKQNYFVKTSQFIKLLRKMREETKSE